MPDFEQLIPELSQWKTDIDSWIGAVGRFDHAIAYVHLFWPEFKIHRDCVLFADCSTDSFGKWMEHTGGNLTAVESVLNHRHILDFFTNSEFEATSDVVRHLGRVLKDIWTCKLARDFPDRAIVVSFTEDYCEDLADYQITFFTNNERASSS